MSRFSSLQDTETARIVRRDKAGALPILAPAGTLRLREVLGQAAFPAFLFVFILLMEVQSLRMTWPLLTGIITWLVTIVALLWPVISVVVYVAGIWRTISESVARTSAVIFWMYWPVWRLLICIAAIAVATTLGNSLWYDYFQRYEEYYRLQAYDNVNAHDIAGIRLQDAGLVQFNDTDGVDRSKGGCIVNGDIFCVAPIVQGGDVQRNQSINGVVDLFMAGINCCNCPMTDFRCGAWDDAQSRQVGGMRLLGTENDRMFKLAAEKFGADYKKVGQDFIFFEWTNNPIASWNNLWTRGLQLALLYCTLGVLGSFLLIVILNGLAKVLGHYNIAAPINEHMPLLSQDRYGTDSPRRYHIPHLYEVYMKQREPHAAHDVPMAEHVIL